MSEARNLPQASWRIRWWFFLSMLLHYSAIIAPALLVAAGLYSYSKAQKQDQQLTGELKKQGETIKELKERLNEKADRTALATGIEETEKKQGVFAEKTALDDLNRRLNDYSTIKKVSDLEKRLSEFQQQVDQKLGNLEQASFRLRFKEPKLPGDAGWDIAIVATNSPDFQVVQYSKELETIKGNLALYSLWAGNGPRTYRLSLTVATGREFEICLKLNEFELSPNFGRGFNSTTGVIEQLDQGFVSHLKEKWQAEGQELTAKRRRMILIASTQCEPPEMSLTDFQAVDFILVGTPLQPKAQNEWKAFENREPRSRVRMAVGKDPKSKEVRDQLSYYLHQVTNPYVLNQ